LENGVIGRGKGIENGVYWKKRGIRGREERIKSDVSSKVVPYS
jgi:hypothetical protein